MGNIYIIPTPIGNLKDITFRAIEVLKEVDFILAEDTRTSGKLLKYYEITTPMQSHHMHNEHKTIEAIITNESLRSFVSFVLIFVILMVGLFALSKLLNIKVDTENPSIMAPVYEGILSALSSLDTLINARNVDGLKNKFFGAILGLFIGGTFVLIVVLILQNMSWVTQNHAWVETSGALRTFQDWSVDVKPVLSKYLLFVELDPGDVVVEFIESEILKD